MKRKILYIAPHLSTGGMPQYLYKEMELLRDEFEIYCVEWTNVTGGVFVVQRNKIENLLGNRLITLGERKEEVTDVIKRINPDVIHLQEIPELFIEHRIAEQIYTKDRRYSIIETSHDSSQSAKTKRFFPDKFLFVSQYQVKQYQELGIPSDVVEYPIESFQRTKTREEAQRELGMDPAKKHIINVGLFTPRKNQAEIVEYARALKDYPVQFHFIGNQADNFKYYWEPLMQDWPENCKWWNERTDVDNFYQAADLFLFTSRGSEHDKETMPLVIREAISWGVPSLIYNLPVYENYFDKYENIKYFNMDNTNDNFNKILDSIDLKYNKFEDYFSIEFIKEENKIILNYKKEKQSKFKIVIKDKDSNASIYWFNATFENYNSWWVIPTPIHSFNFVTNPFFGTLLIEFYSINNVLVYTKEIYVKEPIIKKTFKLDLKNPFDCLFNNYNEMFVDRKYDCYNLKNLDIVFDIGANNGLFSLLMLEGGCKKIYAFEPNVESLINLKHISHNKNIQVVEKAIYTKDSDLEFFINPDNTTIGSLLRNHLSSHTNVEKIIVPAISLKTFIQQNNIEKISLVKMDIEGAEYEIINCLEDEVYEKIDMFLIEFHDNTDGRVVKMIDKLKNKDYIIEQIRDQRTENNLSIMNNYSESEMGTILAKKRENTNKNYLLNECNIDIHQIYNAHFKVQYKGVPYLKCPMDYVMYQMLIMNLKPDLIIEIGTFNGGGALYYADLLYLLGKGEIHTINLQNEIYDQKVSSHSKIKFFYGGFENYDLEQAKGFETVMVIDDGSHSYEDVIAALKKFSSVVTKNSYFIVEDGVIDFIGYKENYNGGPRRAINEFLQSNSNFEIDRSVCDFFGNNATFNPDGYLKRIN